MKDSIKKELIKKEGLTSFYQLTGTCTRCGESYSSGNIFAASYCLECAEIVKKEKTRERVRRFRKKKQAEETGVKTV